MILTSNYNYSENNLLVKKFNLDTGLFTYQLSEEADRSHWDEIIENISVQIVSMGVKSSLEQSDEDSNSNSVTYEYVYTIVYVHEIAI